jgi:hypothetical protein
MDLASLAAALLLALVHVLVGRLRLHVGPPRSTWLSVAGGATAAYAALHLLPEVGQAQQAIRPHPVVPDAVGQPAYLLLLAGMVLFHGLDRLAGASAAERENTGSGSGTSGSVFALHIGFFSLYNALLGHLLALGVSGGVVPYVGALALHFTVNDAELREHHRDLYHRYGRWTLAAAVLAGWLLGATSHLPPPLVHATTAVVAGGVLLNIFKHELPPDRQPSYGAFLLGIAIYGGLRWVAAVAPP